VLISTGLPAGRIVIIYDFSGIPKLLSKLYGGIFNINAIKFIGYTKVNLVNK
jgi:hypothetical protein